MRSFLFAAAFAVLLQVQGFAAEGEVIKVLPHLLDAKGRHALSPSLFERDAYQAHLRKHPTEISGVRFDVHWKASGEHQAPLKIRIEVRASKDAATPVMREITVEKPRFWSRWSAVEMRGKEYENLGEILAWKASLFEGDRLLGEQRSFLW